MFGNRKPKDERLPSERKIPANPRQEMKKYGRIINQNKSKEMLKQELKSHLQNFQETFSPREYQKWLKRKYQLEVDLGVTSV